MTIRAKLYAAIAMTVLGPLVTIGVALQAFGALGDRFDDVSRSGADQALALELKFAVTDANGWQTAYGYDGGRSRERFVRSSRGGAPAARPRRRAHVHRAGRAGAGGAAAGRASTRSWRSTSSPTARCQAGDEQRVRRIFLGPEIEHFEAMAEAADGLAAIQARQVADARRELRRRAPRRAAAPGGGRRSARAC